MNKKSGHKTCSNKNYKVKLVVNNENIILKKKTFSIRHNHKQILQLNIKP